MVGIFLTMSSAIFAQGKVTGKLIDADTDEPLVGAAVVIKGTTVGTVTSLDGAFVLNVPNGKNTLMFSYLGYIAQTKDVNVNETLSLGAIKLEPSAVGIDEVSVVASVAVDRETPIAMSSIKASVIQEKLGTQEFPEILKQSPSIYVTKQGGGFGDSRINVRGFDQTNVAVMINGVPVNDMENGWVYWSNWAGLSDVTRSMQVQRGLGAAKIAVPSVGGSINILTNTTDAEKGGDVFYGVGNDGYNKVGVTVSTGLNEKGWAATISLSKTEGDGYVDGTQFKGQSYFLNISKRINDKHSLAFTIFGAPQWHNQRSYTQSVYAYLSSNSGIKYNPNWGYKDGEVLSLRKNFYHKPQAILNHSWKINETTYLGTAVYASIGTGGGTGPLGSFPDLKNGQVDFDTMVSTNIANGSAGSTGIIRSSVNNHEWYGFLTNLRKTINNLTLSGGLDGRYYIGKHYREVEDLLGGEYYLDDSNLNDPEHFARKGDKIAYHDNGKVRWLGIFAQAEYKIDNLSAFVSGSLSDKGYQRIDYFNYLDSDPDQTTSWQSFGGASIKGGLSYNLNATNFVFANAGYMTKQPTFDAVFLNNINFINADAKNEKVLTYEIGYGLRSAKLVANVSAFHTAWNDKAFTKTYSADINGDGTKEDVAFNLLGIDAIHQGLEVDFTYKPNRKLNVYGMMSLGDYRWKNDLKDVQPMVDNQPVGSTLNFYLKDVHVGNSAQTSASLGLSYEVLEDFKLGLDYMYYDRLYADFEPTSLTSSDATDVWELPSYGLIDGHFVYNFKFAGLDASFNGKVNNLLNTKYFSEGDDGATGLDAYVFYGYGRTWSTSLKINF